MCRELLPQRALGEGFHAIDTSNVMDYCGAWNLVLACVPCLEATTKQTSPFRPFVFTEQILGVASTVDDMLREVLPYDEVREYVLLLKLWAPRPRESP